MPLNPRSKNYKPQIFKFFTPLCFHTYTKNILSQQIDLKILPAFGLHRLLRLLQKLIIDEVLSLAFIIIALTILL